MSTLNLSHCCLSRCTPRGTGRAPPPHLPFASLTTRPRTTATLSSPNTSMWQNVRCPTWRPGWRPGTCTYRSSWPLTLSVRPPCLPTRPSSAARAPALPPRLWLRYDQRFRASAAADSTLRWDVRNNELWLECFTQVSLAPTAPANKPARRPCTYCGSLYHYPDNCPSHPFRARKRLTPPASKSVQSAPTPAPPSSTPTASPQPQHTNQPLPHPCRDFNNGVCRRHTCRFRHVCARCHDQGHRERKCPSTH